MTVEEALVSSGKAADRAEVQLSIEKDILCVGRFKKGKPSAFKRVDHLEHPIRPGEIVFMRLNRDSVRVVGRRPKKIEKLLRRKLPALVDVPPKCSIGQKIYNLIFGIKL